GLPRTLEPKLRPGGQRQWLWGSRAVRYRAGIALDESRASLGRGTTLGLGHFGPVRGRRRAPAEPLARPKPEPEWHRVPAVSALACVLRPPAANVIAPPPERCGSLRLWD